MTTLPTRHSHPIHRARRRALLLWLHIAAVALGLQLRIPFGLARLLRTLDVARRDAPFAPAEATEVLRTVDSVLDRLRPLIVPFGLVRTLTLFRLLRRRGVPLEVHVGVDPDDVTNDRGIRSRCWLSLDGRPLFEPTDPAERYHTVYRYLSSSDRQLHIPVEVVHDAASDVLCAGRKIVWQGHA